MKGWRRISGILSIALGAAMAMQAYEANIFTALQVIGPEGLKGKFAAGVLVAALLVLGGLVSLFSGKCGNGSSFVLIILFGLGAILSFASQGVSYTNLTISGIWCLICFILAIVCLSRNSSQSR